jgi:hypothetical protein
MPKFSDDLREGLKLGLTQCEDDFFKVTDDGELCACTAGMAILGGGHMNEEEARTLVDDWKGWSPIKLNNETVRHMPKAWLKSSELNYKGVTRTTLVGLVAHMNDTEGLTPEEILHELVERGL